MNFIRLASPKLLVTLCLFVAGAAASAARIEGQTFDEQIRVADSELVLNGVGIRGILWIKGYVAGLYMAQKGATPQQVLAVKGAKRIQMKMLLDVESKEFTKAFNVGIRRNSTEAENAALKDRIEQFDHTIDLIGKIGKGDVVNLDFVPARGLVLSVNGVVKGQPIPGEDLYAGILKIFIGEQPVDKKLKAGLLGGAPA